MLTHCWDIAEAEAKAESIFATLRLLLADTHHHPASLFHRFVRAGVVFMQDGFSGKDRSRYSQEASTS